jgi:hypothetical protein
MKHYKHLRFQLSAALLVLLSYSCSFFPNHDAISGASKSMSASGNSLFHRTTETSLETGTVEVTGEVEKAGSVEFDALYIRDLVLKESLFDSNGIQFTGAYIYVGYSLFDILNPFKVQKKNKEIFRPEIDIYIIIENSEGESVVFSWSEIFHTNNPHKVLLAKKMAPIAPYKKEVNYPLSNQWKIVAGNDFFAFRHLDNPMKITVKSFDKKEYEIQRDLEPLFSNEVKVFDHDSLIASISADSFEEVTTYKSHFYGMGMGYHPSESFSGPQLKHLLKEKISLQNPEMIQNGLVCFVGLDGYRTIFSYSELFNRADQAFPILSVNNDDGGYYRIFLPADFYADRSVKALSEIYFFNAE